MAEEKTRWYNSEVGCGVAAFFILVGIGGCNYLTPQFSKSICERLFPESEYVNVGQHKVKSYTIESKAAVIEVDNEPILDYIKKH